MRIKVLLSTLFLFIILTAFTNSVYAFQFGLGPKVGFGIGFLSGDDWDNMVDDASADNSIALSFSVGLMLDMNFYQGDIFGIGLQPEFLYTRTGGGYNRDSDTTIDNIYNLFQLPIYLKPRFKAGKGFFYILFGPDIIIPLGKIKSEGKMGGITQDREEEPDNPYAVGVGAGFGYDLELGPGVFQFGITYSTYFTNFSDTAGQESINNNMVHLNVAYSFTLVE